MRRFAHWTPLYIRARLGEMVYAWRRPEDPWLTRQANVALDSLLKPTDAGLEFGSGRSTIWLARRLKHLTSVEHNTEWHIRVSEILAAQQIGNVAYELRRATHDEYPKAEDNYVTVVNEFKDSSLDFVLVDGVQRGYCSKLVIPKLRNGGLLVIDNVNWFMPSNSRSPNSLPMADGSQNGIWREVHEELASWRRLWTTSGVTDTAIFFKPCRSVT